MNAKNPRTKPGNVEAQLADGSRIEISSRQDGFGCYYGDRFPTDQAADKQRIDIVPPERLWDGQVPVRDIAEYAPHPTHWRILADSIEVACIEDIQDATIAQIIALVPHQVFSANDGQD